MDMICEKIEAAASIGCEIEENTISVDRLVSLASLVAPTCSLDWEAVAAAVRAGGTQQRRVTAAALALVQMDAHPNHHPEPALHGFLLSSLLPLAAEAAGSSAAGAQLVSAAASLLRRRRAWAAASDLVTAGAAAALGGQCASRSQRREGPGQCGTPGAWPLPIGLTSALILDVVAAAAAAAAGAQALEAAAAGADADGGETADAPLALLREAAGGPLLPAALSSLRSQSGAARRAALQQLLPAALLAARRAGPAAAAAACSEAWGACVGMLAEGGIARRVALAALLQHADCWRAPPPAGTGLDGLGGAAPPGAGEPGEAAAAQGEQRAGGQAPDGAAPAAPAAEAVAAAPPPAAAAALEVPPAEAERFWALLRECLADPEPLNRKRALRLLQALLPAGAPAAAPAWAVWMGVYDSLDELHLQAAAWHTVGAAGTRRSTAPSASARRAAARPRRRRKHGRPRGATP